MDYADRIRAALTAGGFTWDAVAERIGEPGLAGLARNSTIPAAAALGTDVQSTLIRLWALGAAVSRAAAEEAMPGLVDALVDDGWLIAGDTTAPREDVAAGPAPDTGIRAAIELKPYATDSGWQGWVCSDLTPGLDGAPTAPRPDHVLGVSPASTTLAQLTVPDHVGSALDLGTGSGVQTQHLATHADRIVATDLNPRALELAEFTAALNQVSVDLRHGDLYAPVAGETFDLIVTNPPFVMSPPGGDRLTYREGTLPGDELMRRVVVDGAAHLAPGGTLQVLGNWARTAVPWEERLAGWIRPTGCEALVLERERLDSHTYIEVWLSDAGLDGSDDYHRRYAEWIDYFATLGIEGVSMGWITLRRPRVSRSAAAEAMAPAVVCETWPHQVHQPVGPELSAWFGHQAGSRLPADELFARRWRVPADVRQETWQHPCAADPEAIVVRRTSGLGRAELLDTASAAFVSVCDGDLTGDQAVRAIALLMETDGDELLASLEPKVRALAAAGLIE